MPAASPMTWFIGRESSRVCNVSESIRHKHDLVQMYSRMQTSAQKQPKTAHMFAFFWPSSVPTYENGLRHLQKGGPTVDVSLAASRNRPSTVRFDENKYTFPLAIAANEHKSRTVL